MSQSVNASKSRPGAASRLTRAVFTLGAVLSLSGVPFHAISAAEPAAPAAAKPANVAALVKYRETAMEIMGKSNKSLKALVAGDVAMPDQMLIYAQTLASVSHTIPSLYPEGSGPKAVKTGAKANIWVEKDKWKAATDKMSQEADKLVEVVKSGDMKAIAAQQQAVGKSCGGCHDSFRVED